MVSLEREFQTLIDTKSAASGTGTSRPVSLGGRDECTFYLQSNGTTTGGTILIEELGAATIEAAAGYAGTWSLVATIAASSFTGGAQTAYHLPNGAYQFVRARISADITGGGTVTIYVKVQ